MSNDPHTITFQQVRDLLAGLGLEPDTKNLRTVFIEPGKVTVVRKRVNEQGANYVVGDGEVATETVMIKVVAE